MSTGLIRTPPTVLKKKSTCIPNKIKPKSLHIETTSNVAYAYVDVNTTSLKYLAIFMNEFV